MKVTDSKTVSMRIRGISEETGEAIPQLDELIKRITGVEIRSDNNTLKSTYDIMVSISKVWKDISDLDRALLLDKLFGKHQGAVGASLLNNMADGISATETALNSFGSSANEQARYMESINARLNELNESVVRLWSNFISTDAVKTFISSLTGIVEVLDTLLNNSISPFLIQIGLLTAALSVSRIGFIKLATAIVGADIVQKGLLVTTKALTVALLKSPLLWISVGAVALITAIDKLNVSFKEQQAIVAGLNEEVNSLGSEYDQLKNKENRTPEEEKYLDLLERELEVKKELLKIETEKKIDKEFFESNLTSNGLMRVNDEMSKYIKLQKELSEAKSKSESDKINEELLETKGSLIETQKSLMGYKKDLGELPPVLEDLLNTIGDLLGKGEDTNNTINKTQEGIDGVVVSLSELQKTLSDSLSNISSLQKALEEYDKAGQFNLSTIVSLAKEYPDLLEYLDDEKRLRQELADKITEEQTKSEKAHKQMLMNSQEFYNKNTDILGKYIESIGLSREEDLKGAKTLAEAKEKVEVALIGKLASLWSSYYDAQGNFIGKFYTEINGQQTGLDNSLVGKYFVDPTTGKMVEITDAMKKQLNNYLIASYEAKRKFEEIAKTGVDYSKFGLEDSASKSSTSTPSSTPSYLDQTEAQIRLINSTHELTASKNELLKTELELSKSIGDFNDQQELTNQLIKGQQQQVSDLTTANSKLSAEMKKLGNANWLDDNGEATLSYINAYNSASKSQQDSMKKTFDSLQKLKKAYIENNDAIKQTTLSMLELAKTSSLEELQRVQENVISTLRELSDTADNSFDFENFADEIRSITYELDKLTGNYPNGISPVNTSSQAMSNLNSYKNTITDIANEVQKMSNFSTTSSKRLESAIKEEIEYAKELKSQLDAINNEIRDKTLLYKQQEDQMERNIQNISDYYDTQIEKQNEKLKLLDDEIEKEDRLKKLRDINDEIAKTKADTRFSYIDAEGNETLTYNKAKVAELEQNRDELVKQFQREDLKQAIQDEIDRLKQQKDSTIKVLQQQLEDTRVIHQQELASMNLYKNNLSVLYSALNADIQTKIDQLSKLYEQDKLTKEAYWNDIINNTRNSTATLTEMLSGKDGWYSQTITDLNSFADDVQAEVNRINQLIQSLIAARAAAAALGGGGSVGGSSGGGVRIGGLIAHTGGIIGDGKVILPEYHVGGTVSGTTPNRITDIVNRLFNVKPGEQVVKMLEGELAVPQQNIMKNFIPNMQRFMSNISLKQTPAVVQAGDTITLNNVTIKANNPQELWEGLKMQIRMNK